MSLTFSGPKGNVERRWAVYAMMRDNVQHHLEGGTPSTEFAELHKLADARFCGEVAVSARKLHHELKRVEREVLPLSTSDLAISIRTRATMTRSLPLPEVRGTVLARLAGWEPPFSLDGLSTMRDVFGSLVSELMAITANAADDDVLRARDG